MHHESLFAELLKTHKNLILKVANVYCFDKEERKDLVGEIVLQLWKSFPSYDATYKFSTWAYRIALNVSISWVRKTLRRSKFIEDYKVHLRGTATEEDAGNENFVKLYAALQVLNPIDRALITLHLEGCSNKEIAEIMGITSSNVSTRMLRIKERLKKQIHT